LLSENYPTNPTNNTQPNESHISIFLFPTTMSKRRTSLAEISNVSGVNVAQDPLRPCKKSRTNEQSEQRTEQRTEQTTAQQQQQQRPRPQYPRGHKGPEWDKLRRFALANSRYRRMKREKREREQREQQSHMMEL